jgi:hypothetical protein
VAIIQKISVVSFRSAVDLWHAETDTKKKMFKKKKKKESTSAI